MIFRTRTRTRTRVFAAAASLLFVTGVAAATVATSGDWSPSSSSSSSIQDEAMPTYNGQFAFARLKHTEGLMGGSFRGRGGWGYCNGPPWQHDYPCAERNLLSIMKNATALNKEAQWGNVFDVADPELHRYPLAYMSHPDSWQMDEKGVENLRSYLLKGGFIIFDDFPASQRSNAWGNFAGQMKRILPEYEPVQIDHTHPIFHSFFDFDSLTELYGGGYGGNVLFLGYFEENDPTKRMLAIVNYNNDLGENWEYLERGFTMIPEAQNESFKFGINYIMYALTH